LTRAGYDVKVLEAQERPGGRVLTLRAFDEGLYGDAGAARIPDNHEWTLRYVKEFKLRLLPFYPDAGLFAKVRRGRREEVGWDEFAGAVEDYVGIELGETARWHKIEGGNDLLPRAFAERLAGKVVYGAVVSKVEQDTKGARVTFRHLGAEETLPADYVVCAIPFAVLGRVEFAPRLSEQKTRVRDEMTYELAARAFMQTRSEDPGFRRDGVLLAEYDLSGRNVAEPALKSFTATLLERVRALPGVESAAIGLTVPLDIHGMPTRFFTLEGRARSDDALDEALMNTVTPGYFAVMGLPILAGHDFADLRDTASPAQAIVNEAFVRHFVDGADAVGRRLETRGKTYLIAGVVRNSLYNAFGEPPTPIIYFSYRDRLSPMGDLHVRPRAGTESALAGDLRRVVRELDPELPLYDIRTLSDHIEANLIFRRIPARMFSVLGPLLLLLAAIGIYAVVAYAVSLRTTEIGVRMALGATARRLVGQFVAEHLLVIGAGALVGWAVAFAVIVNILSAPMDAAVFTGVPVLLLAVAALASWWPARRVTKVDPMLALRSE